MTLEKNIRKIRRYKNITQGEISKQLGISPQAYSKIESGETRLDTTRLKHIAEILQVPLSDLYEMCEKNMYFTQNTLNDNATGVIIESEADTLIKQLTHVNSEQLKEIAFLRQQIVFFNQLITKS
jgi:transcriptional regulator with XRE-family HTH domain